MRAQHAAQQIVRVADVGHPVAHGLIDGIFQCARTRLHAAHLSPQQAHAEDVQLLPAHIFRCPCKPRIAGRRARRRLRVATPCWPAPVSAMMRFLPMRMRQQRLAQAVVDLVRAGVQQVFALEIDLCSAQFFGQAGA